MHRERCTHALTLKLLGKRGGGATDNLWMDTLADLQEQFAACQRREDMTSRRSNNLYALITIQGQESWMQVTRIALWTKSRRAHGVFY